MRTIIFLLVFSFASLSIAKARAPLPDQLSAEDKIWLARAMVAEAGWKAERDHVAIAYVLARRLKRMQQRWPSLRYRDVLFSYAKGLGDGRREHTPRQRWIRSLSPDLRQPDYWPRQVNWERHRALWRDALTRADAWASGRLRDPCRGRAWHWGGTIDEPWGDLVPVDCGETKNTFYTLSGN